MNTDGSATAGNHARSLTYEHGGDKYEVVVGQPRKRYRRRTGPRGGYIKDAGWQGWGEETGSTVLDIVDAGHVIEVWSGEPSHGWPIRRTSAGRGSSASSGLTHRARPTGSAAHREKFARQHDLHGRQYAPEPGYTGPMYRGSVDRRVFSDEDSEAAFQRAYVAGHGCPHADPCTEWDGD